MDGASTMPRRPERKSKPDHLTVFREFLAHLDKASRRAPEKASQQKPLRRKARTRGL
jgi:nitrate reductase assembly molybdenum cofactor insertion protein NarJ